jgi:Kef-type K+ transport system membrane component KefB
VFDPLIILLALGFGIGARALGLPALLGYLAAGFALHELNVESGEFLQTLSDIGITLLLFTIGLKLEFKDLLKPSVWGTTLIHMLATQAFFMVLLAVAVTSGFLALFVARYCGYRFRAHVFKYRVRYPSAARAW